MAQSGESKEMPAKHQEVLEQYFLCWNKTEAYQRVYPRIKRTSAASNAYRLFETPEFQEAISQRLNETAMTADEVLQRVAAHARGDVDDYLDENGNFDLPKARLAKKTGNIKKLKTKKTRRTFEDETVETVEVEFELYDALAAKALLGKYHRIFVDRAEVSGPDGGPIETADATLTDEERTNKLAAILDRARARRDRQAAQSAADVGAVAGATD